MKKKQFTNDLGWQGMCFFQVRKIQSNKLTDTLTKTSCINSLPVEKLSQLNKSVIKIINKFRNFHR